MSATPTVGPKKAIAKPASKPLASKEAAGKRFGKIQDIVRSHWFELGKYLKEGLARQDYKALGYDNARAWMEAATLGSLSGAWKSLRIAKALEGVPEATILKMSEGKADVLARLPEKERRKPEWIERAADPEVTNEVFRQEADKFFESKGIVKERFCDFYLRVPEGAYRNVFEETEKKVARLLSIDLERFPAKRLEVWERMCLFVLTTEDEHFLIEVEGGSPTVGVSE